MNITFQRDYPYDDYFPFNADGQPWEQMRDIRRHGQDAALTLTLDCSLSDDELREVARMLRPYGRMTIRINHECGGTWFTHNKRFTYEQVGKFFAHFSDIIHQEAPHVARCSARASHRRTASWRRRTSLRWRTARRTTGRRTATSRSITAGRMSWRKSAAGSIRRIRSACTTTCSAAPTSAHRRSLGVSRW